MGHVTKSPVLPRRLPPEPSTRNRLMVGGKTMRSPSTAANSGWAAHDHGTAASPVLGYLYSARRRTPVPVSDSDSLRSSSRGSEKHAARRLIEAPLSLPSLFRSFHSTRHRSPCSGIFDEP